MENNESAQPESALNTSENNRSTKDIRDFTHDDLTDAVTASLLSDTEETATYEAENTEETPEVESEGVEDSEAVLSESTEDTVDAESTEEETVAEGETEDDGESEDGYSEDRGLPKGVKKRMDKLIAKKREAEEEAKRLKAEVERLEQEATKPAQTQTFNKNPYATLLSEEQIKAEAEKARKVRRWCEMNPEGTVVRMADGSEKEYTAEEIRNIKIRALDALEEHLPAQMTYVNNYNNIEKVVQTEYTWWKDKSSRERQIAEQFLKHFPEITRFPDYKMVLGDYIRGVKAREASKSKAPTKVPSQPKSVSAPPRQVPKDSANAQVAKQRYIKSGTQEDLQSIIASRFI